MIIGLGIDSVEIERFSLWYNYPEQMLLRIFTTAEIKYCKENQLLSAQRFAVRFAAREAFFKAFNSSLPKIYIPFLTCCRSLALTHSHHGAPILHINWKLLGFSEPQFESLVSLTHTRTTASACIFLKKIPI